MFTDLPSLENSEYEEDDDEDAELDSIYYSVEPAYEPDKND